MIKISSPMATGNGAIVVHSELEKQIAGYKISAYPPSYEYFPFLIRKFSDPSADIIHTTPDYGCFNIRKNQKLVVTLHNYVLDDAMQAYSSIIQRIHYKTDLRLFTKLSLQKAHTVTAVSQFTADLARKDMGFKGEIKVIPNGINEQHFSPAKKTNRSNGRIKVLFSGNLTQRKGAHWIIPILNQLEPNIDIIYTSGLRSNHILPDHPRLQRIGKIPHNEMPALYQQADILLFPTVREGFSLSILEAMSCGLPIVATNCSSLPEQVHHGKGGYLCKIGDVGDFADKINILAFSEEIRRQMGQYNRQRVEQNFTLDKMVQEYKNLFYTVNNAQL
ncbi:MAG: glycosyltransferase family 4 protein [Methylococcaceae bacterium]|nr:glycosyltransferase family 4 protein [Methylococcaceae bacterium]